MVYITAQNTANQTNRDIFFVVRKLTIRAVKCHIGKLFRPYGSGVRGQLRRVCGPTSATVCKTPAQTVVIGSVRREAYFPPQNTANPTNPDIFFVVRKLTTRAMKCHIAKLVRTYGTEVRGRLRRVCGPALVAVCKTPARTVVNVRLRPEVYIPPQNTANPTNPDVFCFVWKLARSTATSCSRQNFMF